MTSSPTAFADLREKLVRSPHDSKLFYACCAAAGTEREDELLALIEARLKALPVGQAIRLHDLHMLARIREKRARTAAGLSGANTDDLSDLEIKFARDELSMIVQEATSVLQHDRKSLAAAILLAEALVGLGAIDHAEQVYAQLRRAGGEHVSSVTSFDPAFHATLPQVASHSAARLPPVLISQELPREAARMVFTAADYAYFQRFGWGFVDSFAKQSGQDVVLALHIFDITPEEKSELIRKLNSTANLRWALSSEWTGLRDGNPAAARGYYHAVRFIRFWQLISDHHADAWMIDMDTIFNAGIEGLFETLSGHDLVLFLTPGRIEVRNKVMATCTGVANTQAARDYIRNISGYVGHYQKEGRLLWGIDQIAMFAVLTMYGKEPPLRIRGVPETIADGGRRPGQILWPAKGE